MLKQLVDQMLSEQRTEILRRARADAVECKTTKVGGKKESALGA